jgi:cytochrome c553
MRIIPLVFAASIAVPLAACAPLDRSRDLANASVPASATAAQVCSNCHGLDGNSVSPNFPRLAAQPAQYLELQLKEFRSHSRGDPAGFEYMWGLSRHLSDAQIAGLAEYFSRQVAHPNVKGDPQLSQSGRAIFEGGIASQNVPPCATCHGPQGHGVAVYPRIAGQHADYVMKQLTVYQRTEERPAGAVMKVVAHSLTRQEMRAVAAYVQGLD